MIVERTSTKVNRNKAKVERYVHPAFKREQGKCNLEHSVHGQAPSERITSALVVYGD